MGDEEVKANFESADKNLKKSYLRREAQDYSEGLAKRGVIYIARIPPFMKPNKMRNIFEEYGEVTRLYLAEEDAELKRRRKDAGGNASKQFNEGWIEYADKKMAKQVADSLNNTPMGGKKSSFYHDDIWNLKYLKGFKWEHLTEKIAYERRIRENKLKAALQQTKKVNAEFMELVDKAKTEKFVEERKEKRRRQVDGGAPEVAGEARPKKSNKSFHQVKPLSVNYGENKYSAVAQETLSSIFRKQC